MSKGICHTAETETRCTCWMKPIDLDPFKSKYVTRMRSDFTNQIIVFSAGGLIEGITFDSFKYTVYYSVRCCVLSSDRSRLH